MFYIFYNSFSFQVFFFYEIDPQEENDIYISHSFIKLEGSYKL